MGVCASVSRRYARLLAALFAGLILLPAPLRAQDDQTAASGKLAAVKITGSTKYPLELVAAETGLSSSSSVTKADLQNGADRLARCGLFSNVNYRFYSTDAGVVAQYEVTDAPTLPVYFDNFPWFTDDELTAALKKEIPLFEGNVPEGGSLLHDITGALEYLLAARGVHSSVSAALFTVPLGDRKVQQLHVDNAAVNIGGIEFGDALAKNERGLQQRPPDVVGQPYSRTLVA